MSNTLAGDWQMYRRLLSYVRPYSRVFAVSIIAMLVLALTNPATAALFKYIVEGVFLVQDSDRVLQIIVALVSLSVIAAASNYISSLSLHWVSNRVVMDLRAELFWKLLHLPSTFYDRFSSGSLVSRFSYDVTQIKEASTNVLTVFVRDSLTIIGLFGWMLYVDWQLSMITLLTAPVIAVFLLFIRQRLRRMSLSVQESMGDINHLLSEVIAAQKIIKIFSAQKKEQERFQHVINRNRRYNMKFSGAAIASSPVVQLVTILALAAIIYLSSIKAVAGSMGVDDFVSFFTAILMILAPLKRLVRINEHVQRGLAACQSVFALLDEQSETTQASDQQLPAPVTIDICNVSFCYPDSDVSALENINLFIGENQNVAIVGISGSGKSTLANLLTRFYEPSSGTILIGGVDIHQPATCTTAPPVFPWSPRIFTCLITPFRHNIAYARPDASQEEIELAAMQAHAHEFIRELADGYDTVLGEHGANLSGGQRQRIALARAILKDSPVLILDEATSSLDTESERHIQSALAEVGKSRICIIIAHRLSTIESADRIVVIERGQIVEQGQHQELLQAGGSYARLYETSVGES